MTAFSNKTNKEFIPYEVKGYLISAPLTANNAGNCMWGFAEKYGKRFFIKQFLNPKFPDANAEIYESTRIRMINQCEEWYKTHEAVYEAIITCGGSNLVTPLDFFLEKNIYYLVTESINASDIKFEEIYKHSSVHKDIILKVLAHEIACLANKNVVHSDLKPDNIIVKSTVSDFFTVKIIDFDASFLTSNLPEPDDITGDQVYFSPEMLLYMAEEEGEITTKSDVFALGILFHIILCGQIPQYNDEFDCLAEAVLNGDVPTLSADIPQFYKALICDMLKVEVDERISAVDVLKRLFEKDTPPSKNQSTLSGPQVSKNGIYINMKR